MLGDGGLAFAEFVMQEPLPLASIHRAILEFLRNADDVVLFGAQAVNAYVDEPRMTHRVAVASTRGRSRRSASRSSQCPISDRGASARDRRGTRLSRLPDSEA